MISITTFYHVIDRLSPDLVLYLGGEFHELTEAREIYEDVKQLHQLARYKNINLSLLIRNGRKVAEINIKTGELRWEIGIDESNYLLKPNPTLFS